MMQGRDAAVVAADFLPIFATAWLACLGVPLGALALLLGSRIAGAEAAGLFMRPMAMATPAFVILAAPMALALGWGSTDLPLAAGGFGLLLGWSVLAWLVAHSGAAPFLAGWVIACLSAHLVMVTFAVSIWIMPFGPPLAASAFGVIVAVSQVCAATAFGALLFERMRGTLLGLVGVWAGVAFVQALVLWSANDPKDVAWFQAHEAGAGAAVLEVGVVSSVIALGVLSGRASRAATILGALLIIVSYLAEIFWLMVPAMSLTGSLIQVGGFVLSACVVGTGAWVICRLGTVRGFGEAGYERP